MVETKRVDKNTKTDSLKTKLSKYFEFELNKSFYFIRNG